MARMPYTGPMTDIDKFYADMNAIVVESIFAFEAEAIASMVDPETAPDPEFADMAAEERTMALDEWEAEEREYYRQVEWERDNRWGPW